MPFPDQTPKPYTRAQVEALRPGQMGVYGLFKTGTWVYVGQGDIRQRLLDHFSDNPRITRQAATHWVDELVADEQARRRREAQLIAELSPVCNQRVG